jgi:acetoin utilization protein AcuC
MMPQAAFVYEDALAQHVLRPEHPMRPVRLRYTYELLEAYGAFQDGASRLVRPREATPEEVGWLHTPDYIAAVRALSLGLGGYDPQRFGFSAGGDNPVYPGMYQAALLSTGASLVAAELVASGQVEVAFNISGGLHHAAAGHASGFCIFNDPVVAINYLLTRGNRVAYVDIDAHHGDGVQDAFYADDRVLTISLHESGRFLFPGTGFTSEIGAGLGEGYAVNLPLYPYTEDELYLWSFRETALPLIRAFKPDFLVTQLGIDSYHSDPLTHLQITSRGYVEVIREFAGLGIPWVALGGGGYDLGAVARCWSLAYGVMLGTEWPNEIPMAFARQYGLDRLRDAATPDVPDRVRREARDLAEESVSAIKGQLFAIHNLGG